MKGWWGAQEGFLDKVECGMLQSGGGAVAIAEKLQKQKPVRSATSEHVTASESFRVTRPCSYLISLDS